MFICVFFRVRCLRSSGCRNASRSALDVQLFVFIRQMSRCSVRSSSLGGASMSLALVLHFSAVLMYTRQVDIDYG